MISPLSRILADYESLREYEAGNLISPTVDSQQVIRRIIALERAENPGKSDSYYDGLGAIEIGGSKYHDIKELMVDLPCELGNNNLFRKRDLLYVKSDSFKDWMELIVRIPPLWIIAGSLMKDFDLEQSSSNLIRTKELLSKIFFAQFRYSAMPAPYIPDLIFLVDKEHGLDDLHLHLNGTTETDVIWPFMLSHPYEIAKQFKKVYCENESVKKLSEQVMPGTTPNAVLTRLHDARNLRNIIVNVIGKSLFGTSCTEFLPYVNKNLYVSELLSGAYLDFKASKKMRSSLIEELLFYLCTMKIIVRDSNDRLAGLLHHYMLIKGMIHRFLVMQQSQVGFSQFQLITNNSFRWDVERKYEGRFKQLAGCAGIPFLRTIEGRFAPRLTSFENRLFVDKIVSGFEKAKKECPDLLRHADLKLIAHFIKRADSKKDISIRHQVLRAELKRKSIALIMFKRRDKEKYGRYVCGIDAAASEFDARPEVFAAAYRYLREHGIEHFTFHAGEDFHHLLSGIRAIFEAVVFLNLKSGDRLGHCTAIGINPEVWLKKVGKTCYISRGEWLDDMVFVWYLIKEYQNEALQSLVLRLESEISSYALKIYGSFKHPSELSDAWMMRYLCPIPELNDYIVKPLETSLYKRKQLKSKLSDRLGFTTWCEYYQVNENLNQIQENDIRLRYDEIIKVKNDDLFKIADMKEIQKIVLNKMSKENIVIEALPSSNMHISFYDDLKEYHLMRWLNVEGNECMMPSVVLGSDDPGIFMTNIYNEYAMAYLHFENSEYSPSKRVEKISNIQQFSEIYRF